MLEPMFQWLKFLHLWWIYLEIGRDPKNVNKLNLHTYWAIGPRPVLLKNLLELHTLIWALDWLAQSQEPVWKPPGNHAASDNTQMGEIWQIINWVVDSLKKKKKNLSQSHGYFQQTNHFLLGLQAWRIDCWATEKRLSTDFSMACGSNPGFSIIEGIVWAIQP